MVGRIQKVPIWCLRGNIWISLEVPTSFSNCSYLTKNSNPRNQKGVREISKSARSVFVFGLYLAVLGIVLLVASNFLLGMFGLPSTTEVWIRTVGMLVLFLGFYYTQAARKEMAAFFRWTVERRYTVIIFFVVFVLLGFASPPLIIFGVMDLLGAIWTGLALRSPKTT